jgi:hypothetical protein
LAWLLHWLLTVVHALSLEGPGSEPVLEVLEGLESLGATDNLGGVISSEEGIWGLSHLLGGDGETDHSSVNNTVVLERPEVMKLLFLHVLVWRKTENSIRVVAESLGLVESQELEESALVVFKLHFELNSIQVGVALQWLDASVILPNETLEFGRSISQFG